MGLVLLTLVGLTTLVLPEILQERARDWETFAGAGRRLVAGADIYFSVDGDVEFIYPPAMALLWASGLTGASWLAIKILALSTIGVRERTPMVVALPVLCVLTPAVQHDLVLGNVMVLYLVATWTIIRSGRWLTAVPLGIVIAIAAKPAVGPILVWLLVTDPRQFVRVGLIATVVSVATAIVVGPTTYVEYLRALVAGTEFLRPWAGNMGLSSTSAPVALVGVLVAYVVSIVVSFRLSRERAAAAAFAMTLLAQPSFGLPYEVFLIAPVALIWCVNRRFGIALALVLPIIGLFSPILATLLVSLAAIFAPDDRPSPTLKASLDEARVGAG